MGGKRGDHAVDDLSAHQRACGIVDKHQLCAARQRVQPGFHGPVPGRPADRLGHGHIERRQRLGEILSILRMAHHHDVAHRGVSDQGADRAGQYHFALKSLILLGKLSTHAGAAPRRDDQRGGVWKRRVGGRVAHARQIGAKRVRHNVAHFPCAGAQKMGMVELATHFGGVGFALPTESP